MVARALILQKISIRQDEMREYGNQWCSNQENMIQRDFKSVVVVVMP